MSGALLLDILKKFPWLKTGNVTDPKPSPKPGWILAFEAFTKDIRVKFNNLVADLDVRWDQFIPNFMTWQEAIEDLDLKWTGTQNLLKEFVDLQTWKDSLKDLRDDLQPLMDQIGDVSLLVVQKVNEGFSNIFNAIQVYVTEGGLQRDLTTAWEGLGWFAEELGKYSLLIVGGIVTAVIKILSGDFLSPGYRADGGLVEKYAKGGKTKRKKKACCSNCAMGFSAGKMSDGGKLNGPSHAEGGIPIEVEGGEYIVNKSDTTKFLPILEDINYNSGEMWQHFVNATSILNTNLKDQLIINDKISKILTEFNDKLYDLSLAYATDTVMARASQVSDIPSLASSTSSFSGATASLTPVVTVIPKLLTVGKKQRVVRNVSLDIPGDSTTIDARSNKGDVSSESVAVKPMASTQGISMTPSPIDSYNVSRMAAVYSLYGIG